MNKQRLDQIKAWVIYARKDCRHDDNCSAAVKCLPACVKEIERLRKLVKNAHREGFAAIEGFAAYDKDDYFWNHSEARKALEAE